MTAKEYVVRQVEGYTQLRNDITTLEFELKSLAPFDELQTDDLIETLTFSHHTEDCSNCLVLSHDWTRADQRYQTSHRLTTRSLSNAGKSARYLSLRTVSRGCCCFEETLF